MAENLKYLRSRLEEEQKRLREELAQLETTSQSAEERREGSPFGKREEEAEESLALEKRVALERRISGALAEVEQAIHKFNTGTYGLCDACGKPIAADRLEALPQAALCLDCKAKGIKGKTTG